MKGYMKLDRIIISCLLGALLFTGCNKDDDDVTYLYLDGSISFSMPKYVKAGDSFTFKKSEISTLCKEGLSDEEIGYIVTDPYTSENDTLDTNWESFSFTVRDTLGEFTLIVKGFVSGYVNSSYTCAFVTIDPNFPEGSVSNTGILHGNTHIIDSRDNNWYYYTKIGNLLWTRNNIAYQGSGVAYENSDAMSNLFGRFYTFNQALTVCPQGWRLPSNAEWEAAYSAFGNDAGAFMVNASFNDKEMWQYWNGVVCSNKSDLSIIPVGFAYISDDGYAFKGSREYAAIWTSDTKDGQGIYRYLYKDSNVLYQQKQDKDGFGISVRCVKEVD